MDVSTTISDLTRSVVERITGSAGSQMVFGPPYEAAGRTVIPVAEVRYAFGIGAGGGSGTSPEGQGQGSGGGGGGGGGVQARPVGFIEVTGDEARFVPIFDYSRIILAAVAATAAIGLASIRNQNRRSR